MKNAASVKYYLTLWPWWYLPGGRGTCSGHWISRYGTKLSILCWCATATRSRPPHWLYQQIPPSYGSNDRAMQSVAWLTRSSANADKPGRRQKYTIYNRLGRCAAELLCIYDCHNGGRPTSWILYFRNFCEKLKFAHISSSSCKIWWRWDRVIAYFRFSKWQPSAIADHPRLVFDGPNILLKLHINNNNNNNNNKVTYKQRIWLPIDIL